MECLRQNRRAPRRYFMSQLFLTKGEPGKGGIVLFYRASWPTVTVNRRVIRRRTEIFTTGIEFLAFPLLAPLLDGFEKKQSLREILIRYDVYRSFKSIRIIRKEARGGLVSRERREEEFRSNDDQGKRISPKSWWIGRREARNGGSRRDSECGDTKVVKNGGDSWNKDRINFARRSNLEF